MIINIMIKIRQYIESPKLFLFISLVLTIILLIVFNVAEMPDYYIDKNAAYLFVNNSSEVSTNQVFSLYGNKNYFLHNGLLHLITFSSILFIFLFLFKIKTYKELCDVKIFSNRIFLFIYLNIAYPIWMNLTQRVCEVDIEKYVYPIHADSICIAFMGIYFMLFLVGIIYYPLVNIFNFVIYNTKFVNKFIIIIYEILFVLLLLYVIANMFCQYTYEYYFLYVVEITYLFIVLNSINYLIKKQHNKYI